MQMKNVEEVIQVLDEAEFRLKIGKCKLAQKETEWLGYKLSAAGINSIEKKVQVITERLREMEIYRTKNM